LDLPSFKQNPNETNWYAVYTRPNAEKKVFDQLEIIGFQAYLPLVTSIRKWSDRKKKITSPLISTFVFVRVEENRVYETLKVRGALGILKYLSRPAVIKDYEIENLRILMNDVSEVSRIEGIDFEDGEDVMVVNGPFTGLIAQSVIVKGKRRIIVKIDALGSFMEVNLPLSYVVKKGKMK
jgi:transcriptional antiterminator RfaH